MSDSKGSGGADGNRTGKFLRCAGAESGSDVDAGYRCRCTGDRVDGGFRENDTAGDAQADGRSLWNRRAAGGGVWQLMDWNGFLREKKWKHVKKDQWLILFLAGVLLLIIAMPAGRKNSTRSDVEMNTQNSQSAVTAQGGSDYETYGAALEQRLETILQRMRGVGDVQVMITFRDQGESIVEKDVTMREDTQEGEQKEGETDTVNGGSGSCENSETTVYARSDGDETPFVNRAILPKIDGVLIVAEGGDDSEVRKNISESVEALFGLDAHKIKIVKMKTKGDSN